jgi:hypothetical protein
MLVSEKKYKKNKTYMGLEMCTHLEPHPILLLLWQFARVVVVALVVLSVKKL